jgi:glycosyltransferase involved in cell wall biosynthesis
LENYLQENSDIKDRIIFTWNLNRDKLFEYYKKSKFFLLTSLYEWFACVLVEAAYFWNIIIARDVWGIKTITNNWKYGFIYEKTEDAIEFIKNNNTIQYNEYHKHIEDNFLWKDIIEKINNQIILWKKM